jgi:2-polyprenyl-6-hydroxyphenyl methylase/3-demethylubiquinone-9 3-methyltransferase
MTRGTRETQAFYDSYWPQNVPDYNRTREHVTAIVPRADFQAALDGGCGTGVCSLALADLARQVVAVDLSRGSLLTAAGLSRSCSRSNVHYCQGSLLDLPLASRSFDLVFSWGVIHHTVDPIRALDELVRVLRPGGTLVLAVYLKTRLTFVHEAIRHVCLRMPPAARRAIIASVARLVRFGELLGFRNNVRDDNPLVESQVEDWYFVPVKHFFTIEEMRQLFTERSLTFEVVCEQTGRFRSSSNFIVRGTLGEAAPHADL